MQVPTIDKVVINMGVGESVGEPKALENAVSEMTAIAGQKPALRRAKKAISNFKLREGVPIGCMVTLRGNRMYEFLDRLITLALAASARFSWRSLPKVSMVVVTTIWELKSRLYSPKSITIELIIFVG